MRGAKIDFSGIAYTKVDFIAFQKIYMIMERTMVKNSTFLSVALWNGGKFLRKRGSPTKGKLKRKKIAPNLLYTNLDEIGLDFVI